MRPGIIFGVSLLSMLGGAAQAISQQNTPMKPPTPFQTAPQQVQVTAFHSPVAAIESPVSSRILTAIELQRAAAGSLDGKLRTVPGFDLFRRSSSLVANPTIEGVSLRGLGSTAASRTLVLLGDVPLNDPFGGWVHWEELPALSIGRVEVVRGGVSDLYGSSAVGGVVQISTEPLLPESPAGGNEPPARLALESSYGAEALNENGGRVQAQHGRWAAMAAAGVIATDGYTLVAPNLRGPVDTDSNVHAQNALLLGERRLGSSESGDAVWLRSNVLNESRHNGTTLTGNQTRLWRYAAGLDLANWQGRAWGSTEHFRQNFSAVAPGRVSERLTRFVFDPADELGAALRWHRALLPQWVLLAGSDVRDIRASDTEHPITGAATDTTGRQTDAGGYGESLWTPGPWLMSLSARIDRFRNADAATYTLAMGAKTALPSIEQTILDPRAGLSLRLLPNLAVSASAFRAYRAPTENELYRTGQVGQQTTLPNPSLRAERTTGWETGLAGDVPARYAACWRVGWFWNEVNRPITALTLSTTPTATTLMRENLGQLRSRGVSADLSVHLQSWLAVTGGYQFAKATVTRFAPEPALVGKWIPQVPRNTGTVQVTANRARWGLLSVQARGSGRQFDDDANTYVLHGFWRFDVYASHSFGQRWEVFTAVENLLDRSIDIGRTPIRTLGTPQLVRVGLRVRVPL
jgi:outer membrane cobalamin receptor